MIVFSSVIFFIGLAGVLIRRNLLVMLMSVELMLNAVNMTFITFAKAWGDLHGQVAVIFVVTVAAAEIAVGLGIVIALFRGLRTTDAGALNLLKE